MDQHGHNVVAAGGSVVTLTTAFVALLSHPIPLLQNLLSIVSISVGILTLINMLRKSRSTKK
jgi:hypothetical protein